MSNIRFGLTLVRANIIYVKYETLKMPTLTVLNVLLMHRLLAWQHSLSGGADKPIQYHTDFKKFLAHQNHNSLNSL